MERLKPCFSSQAGLKHVTSTTPHQKQKARYKSVDLMGGPNPNARYCHNCPDAYFHVSRGRCPRCGGPAMMTPAPKQEIEYPRKPFIGVQEDNEMRKEFYGWE
eukprot:g51767.t1